MKKIIVMLTFLITTTALAGGVGGGGGGTGPKPTGDDQMILEFTNEFGELEELVLSLGEIENILTRDELILTKEDLERYIPSQGIEPKKIELKDGNIIDLESR